MQLEFGIPPPGFRLPGATRVGAVHLQVGDLDRSIGFYQSVLGFDLLERWADGASLGVAGEHVPLVRLGAPGGVRPAAGGALGLYHFAVLLPDRLALGGLARHLAATHVRVGMADHLVSEALYLTDPDGLGIEMYADRPRQAWQHDGRELKMATEPLDIRDLVGGAAGEEWRGLPAGTRIGHVHLHVGSLRDAEAFYHRALGFDKVVWSYPGALFFSAGGYHHHLGTNTWGSGERPAADTARLLQWELLLPEAAGDAARALGDAGYEVADAAGGWRASDPWGTQLLLTAAGRLTAASSRVTSG